jgi:DNA-binding XRE family transcriptional regulator
VNKIQFIEKAGRREWAVVPYALFEKLLHDAEAAQDLAAYREAKAEDDGFWIPHDILTRELAGEAPVRLWREHRGLTQEALAEAAGISKPYLSQIESGKRCGSVAVLRALAQALEVPLDILTS